MKESPLKALKLFGQSPWLDFIQRGLIHSGELARMIEDWGISGVTSNPTIFEKAIAHGDDYKEAIRELVRAGHNPSEIYEALVLEDVSAAADVLRPGYNESDGLDGFVSLEVSPHLVNDAARTIQEATRLWRALARPNVMIKVPATPAGITAIRRLIGNGVNVNATLLFSVGIYRDVSEAYLSGLENALAAGRPLASIASVASFFLSRIDSMVDPELQRIAAEGDSRARQAKALQGEVAIASARCAYDLLNGVLKSKRFQKLAAHGAQPQRLLWASTGTKNADYSDIKYVEPLIGPHTVNTMPLATLRAYDERGAPAATLQEHRDGAAYALAELGEIGIKLTEVTEKLLEEGITSFIESFDALHVTLGATESA